MTTFSFDPSEANPVLPEGEYDAVVMSSKTGATKNGEPKIEVNVKVYCEDGMSLFVTDHIVRPFGIRRLQQLCEATGVGFDQGEVDPGDFVGRNVRVKLIIRRDDTGNYDDTNNIRKYMSDETPAMANDRPDSHEVLKESVAYSQYVKAVRQTRPEATDELLLDNFSTACKQLVPGKAKDDVTSDDWRKAVAQGPSMYIPI